MSELTAHCSWYIAKHLDTRSVLDALQVGKSFSQPDLVRSCLRFISANLLELVEDGGASPAELHQVVSEAINMWTTGG